MAISNILVKCRSGVSGALALIWGAEGTGGYFVEPASPLPVSASQTARIPANFTRPADVNAYVSGDLMANDTIAGNVVPMQFAIGGAASAGGMIRRARLRKTGTSVTNASFRLHLYSAAPVATNGDNGVWLTDKAANYVGKIDITVDETFTDGASGNGVQTVGSEINFTANTYYGLLEARGAYTPVSAEQFTLELEVLQNR